MRFVLGFVLALALVAGGAYLHLGKKGITDRCFGRCGAGTYCKDDQCAASMALVTSPVEQKPARKRRSHAQAGSSAEPEKHLAPGDDKSGSAGDALGRPEHIDMTGPDEKELSQDDIDRIWRGVEPQLSRCITEAVADWPLDGGKIEVSYRIEKDGSVKKVRLIAPQLLLRNGLYGCMRGKITGLRFPSSGGASVVSFPFQLQ